MDLRGVDLNLLVAFDALMVERSVTRAAERLSIGQSAMSSTLGRLRKLFNDPILTRDGRQLVASPLAESLVVPVKEVLIGVESVLSGGPRFDPTTAERTFKIIANDYLSMTFLQPLIASLPYEAPGVRFNIFPTGEDFAEQLRRDRADLLVIPREAFPEHSHFPHQVLFRDRYLVAVDRNHPEIGEEISLNQFSELPYLATSSGHLRSVSEMQLDFLGIPRRTEITAGFGMAPFLLAGTRMVTLVHERLGRRVADSAGIRLLEPPMVLQPITEIMAWTRRTDREPGHRWLRRRLMEIARQSQPGS